jgi:hypothetical protein
VAEWDWTDTGGIIQDGQPLDFTPVWEQPNTPIDLTPPAEPIQPATDFPSISPVNPINIPTPPSPGELASATGEPTAGGPINIPSLAQPVGGGFQTQPEFQSQPMMSQADAAAQTQAYFNKLTPDEKAATDAAMDTLGTNAQHQLVDLATGKVLDLGPGTGTQKPTPEQKTFIQKLGEFATGSAGIAALTSLGLGVVGMAAGRLFAPTPPKLQTPTPVTTPATRIGENVLAGAQNAPGTVPGSLAASMPAGGTGGVANALAPQNLSQFAPRGVTSDLTTNVQNAVAGQRTVSDAALGAAGRELLAQQEQAPGERAARIQAVQDIQGLQRPTAGLAPTLASGLLFSNATQNTLAAAPQPGQTIAPALYEDPIQQAMAAQVRSVLAGNLPTPELDRQYKIEEQTLRNDLLRSQGPAYETSSVGIEALQRMRESQQVRREQYKQQVLVNLAGQEQSRRQFNITQPENVFQGRLANFAPNELQRAQFGENVQANRLGQAQGIAGGLGRTPLATTATTIGATAPSARELLGLDVAGRSAEQANQLQNQAALEAFKAGGQNAADTAKGIAGLFTGAGGAALAASRPAPVFNLGGTA